MANSEERREVACMLREQAEAGYCVNTESIAYALGLDSDGEGYVSEDVFNKLADLIDPVGQVVDNGVDSFCSECDYVLDPDEVIEAKYCPGCGVRLVSERW